MKALLVPVLAMLCGCDRLFGVDFTPDAFQCGKLAPDVDDADADCIADAADNCPGHANFDQADGEADGVGDACDPSPMETGDALLAFEDFDDPASVGWEEIDTTGHFVLEPGSILHPNVADAGSYLLRKEPVPQTAELLVEVALRFEMWGDRTGYPRIRLFVDEGTAQQQGLYCALDADPTEQRESLFLGDPVGGATFSNIALLESPHAIRIRMRGQPSLLSCDISVDDNVTQLPMHPRSLGITWPSARGIALLFTRVVARVEWIAIYTSQRPE